MLQVQVSIGRNTSPGVPMSGAGPFEGVWYRFQRDISDALWRNTRGGTRWQEAHYGTGQWEDQPEDSAHITMLDVFWLDREALSRDLAAIAKRYGQAAVALTVTEPELIAAG